MKHPKVLSFRSDVDYYFFKFILNNTHHPEFHQILKRESGPVRDLELFDESFHVAKETGLSVAKERKLRKSQFSETDLSKCC